MQKYSETEFNSNESLVEYVYHIDNITLLGFKILKLPLKQSDLPTWFSNFIDKKGVFMTRDGDSILISGMENNHNRVLERSSTSFEINTYNRLRVGDYIVYDPRFDDVYATNSDGFIKLLATISGYTLELDTCSEDASAIDDMRNKLNDISNHMELQVLSSDANIDPGSVTAGVIETKKDNINPNHYKFGDMEAMPFIDAVTEFGEFQPVETPHVKDAIKYLIRYPRKNGLEDLKKAQWFINHLIEVREKIEGSVGDRSVYTEAMTSDNSIVTFTDNSEVKYSGPGLAYVQALFKHGIFYKNKSWMNKKIKTLSGDLFVNAGDSLRYVDNEIYFYNQDGGHRLRMKGEKDACR